MIFLDLILIVIGLYLSVYILYDLILLFANFVIKDRKIPVLTEQTRFGIIIPAHNEELFLERLLKSINEQDYPRDLFQTIVAADNCDDNTASIGTRNRALVLERRDNAHRGKGYAIKFALENIELNKYNAVFIIDADSIVKRDLLKQLDNFLISGENIVQCYNGVANPDDSWFTRLLDVSRTISNEILHSGKQKLGLSSHLMGNGMCFSNKILLQYGWDAFTQGEDWEYYAKLILAGETVAYANKARVYHQESFSLKQATPQRMRWSSGRFAVASKYGIPLFFKGLIERKIIKLDASLPLLLPNPSLAMNLTVVGCISSLFPALVLHKFGFLLWFSYLLLLQLSIFFFGIKYTKNKFQNFLSLFMAPLFLIWKMGIDILSILSIGNKTWVRTERKL